MSEIQEENAYKGDLFEIRTWDNKILYMPGKMIKNCHGLAVTMENFGRFNVTHIASGNKISGSYERCDNAILDLTKFALIAATHGFSWENEDPTENFQKVLEEPVPFDWSTITDNDGQRPMTISRWFQLLQPIEPGYDIDTIQCEEDRPDYMAIGIIDNIIKIFSTYQECE